MAVNPNDEDRSIYNMMRRRPRKGVPEGVDAGQYYRYRARVKDLNRQYAWEAARRGRTNPFQLEDLSQRVRSQEELDLLRKRLKGQTLAKRDERLKQAYIQQIYKLAEEAGLKRSAVGDITNAIRRMRGRDFVDKYYSQGWDVDMSFVYAAQVGSDPSAIEKLRKVWVGQDARGLQEGALGM